MFFEEILHIFVIVFLPESSSFIFLFEYSKNFMLCTLSLTFSKNLVLIFFLLYEKKLFFFKKIKFYYFFYSFRVLLINFLNLELYNCVILITIAYPGERAEEPASSPGKISDTARLC